MSDFSKKLCFLLSTPILIKDKLLEKILREKANNNKKNPLEFLSFHWMPTEKKILKNNLFLKIKTILEPAHFFMLGQKFGN